MQIFQSSVALHTLHQNFLCLTITPYPYLTKPNSQNTLQNQETIGAPLQFIIIIQYQDV